jgi:MFS family permease
MTATIPVSRRGEGLGYWGLASVIAFGAAPALGFWIYQYGWTVLCLVTSGLNLLMAAIAWRLPDDEGPEGPATPAARPQGRARFEGIHAEIEWRVMGLALAVGLVTFGYGGLIAFSALFADAIGVAPKSLFLTVMAIATFAGRLTIGRALDRIGHRRVLLPALSIPAIGLLVLAMAEGRGMFVMAALIFGAGFGLLYPSFAAYVLTHVAPSRRGAAFGAILAAFDTGIGTGASLVGWLAHDYGFRTAFIAAGVVGALSLPYFLFMEKRLVLTPLRGSDGRDGRAAAGRRGGGGP